MLQRFILAALCYFYNGFTMKIVNFLQIRYGVRLNRSTICSMFTNYPCIQIILIAYVYLVVIWGKITESIVHITNEQATINIALKTACAKTLLSRRTGFFASIA